MYFYCGLGAFKFRDKFRDSLSQANKRLRCKLHSIDRSKALLKSRSAPRRRGARRLSLDSTHGATEGMRRAERAARAAREGRWRRALGLVAGARQEDLRLSVAA